MADNERVADIYWSIDSTGKLVQHQVNIFCPKKDPRYIPDLEFSESMGKFFQWKYKDLIRNETRWGKDDLRKRGFKKERRRNEEGEVVTVFVQPVADEE